MMATGRGECCAFRALRFVDSVSEPKIVAVTGHETDLNQSSSTMEQAPS
jgi:hypothetical protein